MPTPTSSPSRCPSCQSPVLDTAITCPTCGDFLPISSSALNVGTLLRSGSYRIDGVLGQGGFGITYRAWDTGLSSGVAIKEHFPEGEVIRGAGATLRPSSPQSMIQFEASKKDAFREAQILYQLHHPSIVRVLAAWEENNTVYMAMELLEGETLNQRLASGLLSEVQAVATLRSLLRALEQVHTAGVLHRDLKPDNIMLTAKYGPVLIDFGNARSYSPQGTTRFSKVIATPAYAAPEQFISQAQFGPYTDFYGLAATFYHLLSGQFPTPALERSMGVAQTPLAHLRPDLSPALLDSLEAALSLKVNERPPTAAAWLNLLPNLTGQPSSQTAGHPTGQNGQTRTVNIPNIPNTPNTKSNTPTVQAPNTPDLRQSSAVFLEGISKIYRSSGLDVYAAKEVTLDVRPGEFFSLLGSSGSGKTTCLRCIGGFEIPEYGKVWIAGQDVTERPAYLRDVHTVFQNYALFPHLTVQDNVGFPLSVKGVAKPEIFRRVGEALELVRLEGFGNRKPAQLSGGQQQRVALARALINRPKVLLLDEPLSALDAKIREEVRGELKALQRQTGITFVYVTHDQEEALSMSDRMAVMALGKLEQVGTPLEVYHAPQTRFVAEFIGRANFLAGTVLEVLGARATVQVNEQVVLVSTNPHGIPVFRGQKITVMLRPEKLELGSLRENKISGTLLDSSFTGQNLSLWVATALGTLMLSKVGSFEPLAPTLELSFSAADALILPERV